MGMTANGRSPGTHVVDVLVAVYIPNVGPFHSVKNNRLAPHRLECPHWRTHTTGHEVLGGSKDFF